VCMIAIVLAGGYAKRLADIAENTPKPLLKVAGRPIIAYVFDRLAELDIEYSIISTNLRFERQFKDWVDGNLHGRVEIVADRSQCEEEKPGAICSLAHLTSTLSDDCLIVAGDNLFTSSLRQVVRMFEYTSSPVVALYDVKDRELARRYSTATLDHRGRIIRFVEKPAQPETTLIGTCIYLMPRRTLPRLQQYLVECDDVDRPGAFIQWLHAREEVYGQVLEGYWCDIGTPEQYEDAQQKLKELDMNLRRKGIS